MKSIILLGFALLSAHLTFAQNSRRSAEVFLQIEDLGQFTVYLDQEMIGSNTGKFRFYDVFKQSPTLSILQGNKKIFSGVVDARFDQRVVLSFSARRGLRTLKTLNVYRNNQYALDSFDNYTEAYNTGIVPPRPSRGNADEFEDLLAMVSREPFDDKKINLVKAYTAHQYLSTNQAGQLLKKMTHDDQRLSLAKSLTSAITDPQNLYTLKDSFIFIQNKEDFVTFISNYQSHRPRIKMSPTAFDQLKIAVKREGFDDEKSKVIGVALKNALISTAQAEELLRMYAFEDKALAGAKIIFKSVADPQNYFRLKDVFRFRTTQDEFLDFIARE